MQLKRPLWKRSKRARKTEEYLKKSGIGDKSYFGPEPEFLFYDVRFKNDMNETSFSIDSSGSL